MLTGGCPLMRDIVGHWSFEYLSRAYGSGDTLTVHMAPREVRRFSRFYGKGLGKGAVSSMSFAQFVKTAVGNEACERPPWRYYMQAPLVWSPSSKGGRYNSSSGGQLQTAAGTLHHARFASDSTSGSDVAADLRARVDWDWLSAALKTAECTGIHSCTLWAGMGGGATPMHFDALSNFFTQLVGRKHVLVFPPSQSYNVYPHACEHMKDTYSMLNLAGGDCEDTIDAERMPALARARGLEATLEPGDVLWLPSFYWHFVRQLDEGHPNLSVNTWCGAQPDGSTIIGGRAKSWCGETPATTPGVAELLACSRDSYLGAATLVAASSVQARDALEGADDCLLNGDGGGAVWAEESDAVGGLRTLTTGRWLESEAATRVREGGLGAEISAGQLLTAMAAGEDALSEAEARRELGTELGSVPGLSRRKQGCIGPLGSASHTVATKLRLDLIAELGVAKACALLRVVTRHGRVHPGLAPQVEGPAVNSEAWELTPPAEVDRMMSTDGRADSPYL